MMSQKLSGAHRSSSDRATRPADQAPAGLGDTASVPCAFTPGPWEVGEFLHDGYPIDAPANHYSVGWAIDLNGLPANKANARLIAAAPELYEIGAELLAIFQHPTRSVTIIEQERLERALAKARGQ